RRNGLFQRIEAGDPEHRFVLARERRRGRVFVERRGAHGHRFAARGESLPRGTQVRLEATRQGAVVDAGGYLGGEDEPGRHVEASAQEPGEAIALAAKPRGGRWVVEPLNVVHSTV